MYLHGPATGVNPPIYSIFNHLKYILYIGIRVIEAPTSITLISCKKEMVTMSVNEIVKVLNNPRPDYSKLRQALEIVDNHIQYCRANRIDFNTSTLLRNVLKLR